VGTQYGERVMGGMFGYGLDAGKSVGDYFLVSDIDSLQLTVTATNRG
jgi:hypothetical protein